MSAPRVSAAPGSYVVTWALLDGEIRFEADRLRSHSDGRLEGRVRVITTSRAGEAQTLHHGNLNLAAGRTRKGLSRDLEERRPLEVMSWDQIVEESCRLILEREEEGSPTRRLQPVTSIDVKYLLGQLVLDGLPVLSFAPGGQFKSYLSLYKALVLENGLAFLGGEETPQVNTLILDWEVTESEAARRCTMLANGLGQTYVCRDIKLPLYRHCVGPIQDEASEIAKVIAKNDVKFVVIDSAGLACGGDVASAELAIQFFSTLRKVTASTDAASEILTHVTKGDRREENQQRLPIGSIYWENLARATWELRSEEERKGTYRIGLFPRKCNVGHLEPVGLRLIFEREALVVEPAAVSDVSTQAGALQAHILAALECGPAKARDLMDATGATDNSVRTALTRLKCDGRVENPERGVWRLVGEGGPG